MRIAFILPAFPVLSQTFILNQITALIDHGHEVDVYAQRRPDGHCVQEEVSAYGLSDRAFYPPPYAGTRRRLVATALWLTASHFHKDPLALLKALRAVRHQKLRLLFDVVPFLGQRPYDIVHAHFGTSGLLAMNMRALGLLSGKLLVTFHGWDVNVVPGLPLYGRDCYRQLFVHADLLTVGSGFMARRLQGLGASGTKIIQLPVGVNLARFRFRSAPAGENDAPIVLTVARLEEVKGLDFSLRAFAQVLPRFPRASYWIVGDGSKRNELEALTGELGISGRVRFLGAQTAEQTVRIYEQAHLFVLAGVVDKYGSEEGQGLVLLEAQAIGLPVLATRVGGIPESVIDGKSGFLVPSRDVDALAQQLGFLLEHRELWPAMGRAGRAHVEANYDMEKLNDRLVDIYRGVAGRSERDEETTKKLARRGYDGIG